MNRLSKLIPALVLLAVSAMSFGETAKVADVAANPKKFDGKTISCTGRVAGFKAKTSKKGNAYTTFTLLGPENEKVHVFLQGKLEKAPKEGDSVIVTGKFAAEKKVGSMVFKNEIDATAKAGNGVKPAPATKPAPAVKSKGGKPGKKVA